MLPQSVVIGGHEFSVEVVEAIGGNRRGQVDHLRARIQVVGALSESKREQSLLHEIIHEIDQQCHLELDEPTVWRLAEALYATLKANRLYSGSAAAGAE